MSKGLSLKQIKQVFLEGESPTYFKPSLQSSWKIFHEIKKYEINFKWNFRLAIQRIIMNRNSKYVTDYRYRLG